jgi:hypothetical protein
MNRPHIRFTISLGPWPSQDDMSFVVPLSEFAVREASEKLDFPTDDAPVAIKAFICTPPDIIRNVLRQRREFSKLIGEAVAAKALECFQAQDELMGYKKRAAHTV